MYLLCLSTLLASHFLMSGGQFVQDIHKQHEGCFKDDVDRPDLSHLVKDSSKAHSIELCVDECTKLYYIYAGLQDGQRCYCGSTYGRYGPGECKTRCKADAKEICGGQLSSTVYKTGVDVPGPIGNLSLDKVTTTSLSVRWLPPHSPKTMVTDYHVYVDIHHSYDLAGKSRFMAKHIQQSHASRSATIIGLDPGTQYNVSVSASSDLRLGPIVSDLFWTEVGKPRVPEAPQLVQHGHGQVNDGEIHVKLKPLEENPRGPISAYRVVVLDETDPVPFSQDDLTGYAEAQEHGLKYWITAELTPEWFKYHSEFVVGDNNAYGGYLNYGPLPAGRDFHVTIGAVSTLNNVTKVSYASVSHDQHDLENLVIFEFHHHDDDEEHDHDHHLTAYETEFETEHGKKSVSELESDAMAVGLSVAVAIFGSILAFVIVFYLYLRWSSRREGGRRGDTQELTTQMSATSNIVEEAESVPRRGGGKSYVVYDNESVDATTRLDVIKSKVWNIPRNFVELTHDVIGRGRFGSVVKGNVNKRGVVESAKVQVVPAKILDDEEMRNLVKDLDMVLKFGQSPNVMQLVGLCEDKDTLFVVTEDIWPTLKQALVDSRASQVQIENKGRFSNLPDETIIMIVMGITKGMFHLSRLGICHKKLCARSIYLTQDGQAKIGNVGIVDYVQPGQVGDYTRWTAQEAYKSTKTYVSKCDVWSFGVVLWEIFTLGATPYCELSNEEVPPRVLRGLRLRKFPYISDELYELMLQCWQIDLDERPTFQQLYLRLPEVLEANMLPLAYAVQEDGFRYQIYGQDLELQ